MDIFAKIEEEQQTMSRVSSFNIVENQGRYGFVFVRDESKIDKDFCEFIPVDKQKKCTKSGFFAEKRAERFYKFLTAPQKQYNSPEKQQKAKQERLDTIKKMLERGVNIHEYFTLGMDKALLKALPEDELKLLYEYGYNVIYTLEEVVDIDCYRKNIYFSLEDFSRVGILRNMPEEILEKVIHTRNGLKIDQKLADDLVMGNYYYYSRALIENLQLLLKTGQIQFTEEQIGALYVAAKRNNVKILPEFQALCDMLKIQDKTSEKKYTTQKRAAIKPKKAEKNSKQPEAQEMIDKLFEDAQNSIE